MSTLERLAGRADPEVCARVDELDLPFNAWGIDPYGVSKPHLKIAFSALKFLYRNYFRVRTHGIEENVPSRGRAMLIGNHSGGIAVDGMLLLASLMLDKSPPRLAQGMVEKFINTQPFGSSWSSRTGQFTGLPENAARLLDDERVLMVFPEGARGTAKLYKERHSLVRFGSGFMRLAMQHRAPIVPVAVLGGGEAVPTVFNAVKLGRALGMPYIPVTPYLLPVPLPVRFDIHFGEPMRFEGSGSEEDDVIERHVDAVKERIASMIEQGRRERDGEGEVAS